MIQRSVAIIGLALIVFGAIALFYKGIPYGSRDVVVNVGRLKGVVETNQTWVVPPIIGGLTLASGVLLLFVGAKRT